MELEIRCSRIKVHKNLKVLRAMRKQTSIKRMPLRPDFHHWLDIVTEYKYHEDLRRLFVIRANDGFDPTSQKQWAAMIQRLPERLGESPQELEAIQGTVAVFGKKLKDFQKIGEILFLKGGKPFYILENTTMFSNYRTVCCVIDLEKLVKHGCISHTDLKTKKIEAARWGVIKSAAVYVILCAAAEYIGSKI